MKTTIIPLEHMKESKNIFLKKFKIILDYVTAIMHNLWFISLLAPDTYSSSSKSTAVSIARTLEKCHQGGCWILQK